MLPESHEVVPLTAAGHPANRSPVEPLYRLWRQFAALAATRLGFMASYIGVLFLALLTRAVNLDGSDLWVDEAISYFVADRSPVQIITYTAANIAEHPPGYYFLLHFWMRALGTSEFALRMFTVAGALLAIALTMLVARRWFGKGVALLAGVLFTTLPLAVFLGRDARMYSWFMASVTLMVYLLDHAIHGRRPVYWLQFAAATFMALAFNYLATLAILALALFFIVRWRQVGVGAVLCDRPLGAGLPRPKDSAPPFALVLLVLLGLPALWIAIEPGPRSSALALIDAMREPWSISRLLPVFLGWPLGGAADSGVTPPLIAVAGLHWLLVIAGIIFMIPSRTWRRRDLQWLLMLLVFTPPLAGSVIFVLSKARYYSAVLGFYALAVTLGIVVCWRRSRVLGAVLLAALLFMNGRATLGYLHGEWRPFSMPTRYIAERARPTETVVYTFPLDSFLDLYYDSAKLPETYIPAGLAPIDVDAAEAAARDVLGRDNSAWLMLYPTELKPELVGAGFDRAGFPGEKTWFSGSRGVVRYFAERPVAEQAGGMTWGDDIHLVRWWTSGTEIAAGDALRLQFEWQKLAPSNQTEQVTKDKPSPLISLTLAGADGRIWAARVAAPCNGDCSIANWHEKPVQERQAFYVPLDTPPGRYSLHLAWLAPSGEPMLMRAGAGELQQTFYKLMDVEVTPPVDKGPEAPLAQRSGMQTADGGLTLISLTVPQGPILAGSLVSLPMQLQIHATQPLLEARLVLTRDGQVWSLAQPLGPSWYPSDQWMPGRLVRVQPEFRLPGTLAPSEYAASLTLNRMGDQESVLRVLLDPLIVKDRERRFDMPDDGEPAGIAWEEGIQLARISAPEAAKAGETISVLLLWQAGRPTGGNWKVFLHLLDEAGIVRGQGDGYPLSGGALTPTWRAGEVIVDAHQIGLAGDLPPGAYQLRIGFYNEETNERLPLSPGVDSFTWPKPITITRP